MDRTSRLPGRIASHLRAWDSSRLELMHAIVIAILLNAPGALSGQSPVASPGPRRLALSAVTVAKGPVVQIASTGPLPMPTVGRLRAPDRIYLDFRDVGARSVNVPGDGTLVAGVRVAQHSADPLVTRVVIDLATPCKYSLDTSELASGRLQVSFASEATPLPPRPAAASTAVAPVAKRAAPRTAPALTAVAPVAPGEKRRAPQPERSADAVTRRYKATIESALDRIGTLRAVLSDIDRRTNVDGERLQPARSELTALSRTLESAKPPRDLEQPHELLKSALEFAATALSLQGNAADDVTANASSAAAGALLMLERAEAELGGKRKSL